MLSLKLALLGLLIPVALFEQKIQRGAKLVHRYESGCGYSCNQELAIDVGGVYGDQPNDIVAIRFCSKLPMSKAYAIAASPSGYVNEILIGNYHYTPNRILFLRSEDCIGSNLATAATEYWVVPKGIELPPFVESIKSCQIVSDSLGTEEFLSGERNYKSELSKLVRKLRENPNAVGVALGYYIERPSSILKKRLLESQRFLERSGLPRNRYLIHLMGWTGEYSAEPPEPKPKYPNIFTVEVKSECKN